MLFSALLSTGIATVLADYDMDYGPTSWPGAGGTYVISAVSGQRAGTVFVSETFWAASYSGAAWGSGPLYATWWCGGMPMQETTNAYGYISHSESLTVSWARADAVRQFTDGNTYWTYSCYSRIG